MTLALGEKGNKKSQLVDLFFYTFPVYENEEER